MENKSINFFTDMNMKMTSFVLVLAILFLTVSVPNVFAEITSDVTVLQDDGTLIVSENSSGSVVVDVEAIAKKFYATHADAYDFLSVFTDFPTSSEGSHSIKNDVSGIGLPLHNDTRSYGSAEKLQTISVLSAFNNVIEGSFFDDAVVDSLNQDLMHEFVHRWGIFVGDKFDMTNKDPQARGHYMPSGHMSIPLKPIPNNNNIYGYRDIMGGEDVLKNDDGTFTTHFLGGTEGVSPLTLYLMGLYSPYEVPPITVLHNAKDDLPTAQTTSSIVTIQDIIADSGQRLPSAKDSQKDFKTAVILLTKKGVAPREKTMQFMKRVVAEFPEHWALNTQCRSTMSSDLAMTNKKSCSPISLEKTTATIADPKPLYTQETVLAVTVRDAYGNPLPHRRVRMIPQAGNTRTTKRQVGEQYGQIMANHGVWANGSYMSLTYLVTDASGNARFTLRSGNPYATGRDADMNLAPSSYRYNVIVDGIWLLQKPTVDFVAAVPQEKAVYPTTSQPSAPSAIAKAVRGAILLQVQERGEAWYVRPDTAQRVYLGRPADAFSIMRAFGAGIRNADLDKIPLAFENFQNGDDGDHDGISDVAERALGTDPQKFDTDGDGYGDGDEVKSGFSPFGMGKPLFDFAFAKKQAGKIFLSVERNGEAWYVNPSDMKRYYLGRPGDAFEIMRRTGRGITNVDLGKVEQFSL